MKPFRIIGIGMLIVSIIFFIGAFFIELPDMKPLEVIIRSSIAIIGGIIIIKVNK